MALKVTDLVHTRDYVDGGNFVEDTYVITAKVANRPFMRVNAETYMNHIRAAIENDPQNLYAAATAIFLLFDNPQEDKLVEALAYWAANYADIHKYKETQAQIDEIVGILMERIQ